MASSTAKGSGLAWFIRRGGAVRGPFSSARVRHFVLEGRLELDDEVSADRQEWRRLGLVEEVVPLQMRADGAAFAEQRDAERKGDRMRTVRAAVIATLVIGALIGAVTLVGQKDQTDVRDCAADPAPGVLLEGCRLDGAAMSGAALRGARLANASLTHARLGEADLGGADMRYVNLSGADLSYARLEGANLKGANLRMADLTNADLSAADLSFADLSGARLGGARFDRAVLDGAIWVDGGQCGSVDCPR